MKHGGTTQCEETFRREEEREFRSEISVGWRVVCMEKKELFRLKGWKEKVFQREGEMEGGKC